MKSSVLSEVAGRKLQAVWFKLLIIFSHSYSYSFEKRLAKLNLVEALAQGLGRAY